MAEINSPVNIKEKESQNQIPFSLGNFKERDVVMPHNTEAINAVRSIVPNKSNNEIVMVLQQFDNNVDKAVQAFVDGSATQVLKEWNMTGKKKQNKRKKSKPKQHQGNKDPKIKNGGAEEVSQEPQGGHSCRLNGCAKDNSCGGSAASPEKRGSGFAESAPLCPQITDKEREHQGVPVESKPKAASAAPAQECAQPPGSQGKPRSKSASAKSSSATAQPETKTDESVKKRGPNIEKSVKDLQRCTVSLTKYRMMIKEEVDNSVKKIKAAFAELHSCIVDKEVSLMAEVDKVKEEAMEILTARQKKAEELKRLTDLASQMAEAQLSELRAEIKHFVSERKYDEELGRSARFSCDTEQLKTQIQLCGEISHPKNNYSSRTPCSSVLSSMTSRATTGKQNTHSRKSSSNAKNSDNKPASAKVQSHPSSSPTESSSQGTPTNKQNGPSNQRRRFNPQHQTTRPNGSVKSQGASNEADQNHARSGSRAEHRRQQHNSFRSKTKGAAKSQEQPARTSEQPGHWEKPRRKQPGAEGAEPRPVGSALPCHLRPAGVDVPPDATVLAVPALTLVA